MTGVGTAESRCVLCGVNAATTREHVPPESFFERPYPDNLITVPACASCNQGSHLDDDYLLAFRPGRAMNVKSAVFKHGIVRSAVSIQSGACRPGGRTGHRRPQRRSSHAVRPVYATIVVGRLDGNSRDRYRSRGNTKMPPKLIPSKPIGVMWCKIWGSISRFCTRQRSRVACM
jgi:hypothetical protein